MEVYQNIEHEISKLKGRLYYREDIGKDYNLVIKDNLCKDRLDYAFFLENILLNASLKGFNKLSKLFFISF